MTRVFIANEPLRKNDETGAYERFLPMESAANFGEVVKLTPDGSPPGNVAPWLKMIREGVEASWADGDFLVLVGDPVLLAYAAYAIADATAEGGTLRVLKWERRQHSYSPLTLESA